MGAFSDLWTLVRSNKKLLWLPLLVVALLFAALLIVNPPGAPLFGFAVF